MGYDIADYKDIDPMYGSLEDVDELIAELKKREMKLMMDLVVNHTSNEVCDVIPGCFRGSRVQHEWFLESRSSKSNPKRDWYFWKPPKGFTASGDPIPPNNWAQILGDANSAWTFDEKTGEFYLSLFTPEQPDLNWENEEVRAAVHDAMNFWLVRGANGFRMDVINHISKDQTFPDAPVVKPAGHDYQPGFLHYINGPRFHEFMQEIHREVLSKYDCVTVGEMPLIDDIDEIIRTVGSKSNELNMMFIFDIVNIDNAPGGPRLSLQPFTVADISRIQSKWQRAMLDRDGWNSLFISNHDQPRAVGRYVSDADDQREKGAKLLALMQTTLAGTPYVYQGEELGMRNVPPDWDPATEYKDIESVNFWKRANRLYANDPAQLEHARLVLAKKARDHSRTPVQWDAGPNAGFCAEGVRPWMRVNDDFRTINAAAQLAPSAGEFGISTWAFWKRGLANRKEHKDVFVYGDFEVVGQTPESVEKIFAYVRSGEVGGRWLVLLNFTGEEVRWDIPLGSEVEAWVAGNYGSGKIEKGMKGEVVMRPWEGVLGKCIK